MDSIFLNRTNGKVEMNVEGVNLRALLLFADKVFAGCGISEFLFHYINRDKWRQALILQLFKVWTNDGEYVSFKKIDEIIECLKYVNNQKHKTKKEIILKHSIDGIVNDCKKFLFHKYKSILDSYGVYELTPFYEDDKVLYLISSPEDFMCKEHEQDPYIEVLNDVILESEEVDYMVLTGLIESLMPFVEVNDNNDIRDNDFKDNRFIKIELFDFPPLKDLNYNQLKIVRNELKDGFVDIKKKIAELKTSLEQTLFTPENVQEMVLKLKENIQPYIADVQKNIDNNIYIQQARQKNPETNRIKMCLGITSLEGIVDYYEKSEIILPYVSKSIKDTISLKSNLNKTSVFLYNNLIFEGEFIPAFYKPHVIPEL